jgi:hypothetical protein
MHANGDFLRCRIVRILTAKIARLELCKGDDDGGDKEAIENECVRLNEISNLLVSTLDEGKSSTIPANYPIVLEIFDGPLTGTIRFCGGDACTYKGAAKIINVLANGQIDPTDGMGIVGTNDYVFKLIKQ